MTAARAPGADDPYRTLQVNPSACPQVIEAAYTVLREIVLRSDDDDAPRRLARLGAAHRTLSDPGRRAAYDLLRGVNLRPVDEEVLDELLTRAVADAAPEDVMPAVPGPPGWTCARRQAFLAFHRARMDGPAGPAREQDFAVIVEGRPAGVGRIAALDEPGAYEVGLWLGRSARGRGIAAAAVSELARRAAALGATRVVARRGDALVEVPIAG